MHAIEMAAGIQSSRAEFAVRSNIKKEVTRAHLIPYAAGAAL
jgi:hypothetical protein